MRENRIGRKSKVSDGRSVRVGLVGPKPRPRGVGDGKQANIPVPAQHVETQKGRRRIDQPHVG